MITNARIVSTSVDPAGYHGQPVKRGDAAFPMSPSAIKEFARCPSRWVRGYNPPDSASMKWGRLVDTMLLTPDAFGDRYAVTPATYKATVMRCPACESESNAASCRKCGVKRIAAEMDKPWNGNASECQEWAKAHDGLEIITHDTHAQATEAVNRIHEDAATRDFLATCDTQVLVEAVWEHDGLAVPIRCLIDLAPRADTEFAACLGDLKTTTCAAKVPYQRQCYRLGWHIQAAFNLDIYNAATGESRSEFVHIVSENFAPYEASRKRFLNDDQSSQNMIVLGRLAYRRALNLYAQCVTRNVWPGYNTMGGCDSQGWGLIEAEPFMEYETGFAEVVTVPEAEEYEDFIP